MVKDRHIAVQRGLTACYRHTQADDYRGLELSGTCEEFLSDKALTILLWDVIGSMDCLRLLAMGGPPEVKQPPKPGNDLLPATQGQIDRLNDRIGQLGERYEALLERLEKEEVL